MTHPDMQGVEPIRSALLSAAATSGIEHGFFTRKGGVSEGLYASLNVGLGSKDAPAAIQENRARVAGWFGRSVDDLATLFQIHSADVVTVDASNKGERPQADGQVTATPGIVLGVLTADCGPVLFVDPLARVIGAAHAGWKGALGGVLEATIEAMIKLGAQRERILASLGPSISQASYEVGPEFVARFVDLNPAWSRFFIPSEKPDHSMFDLPALTVERLRAAGVEAENIDRCTYVDEEHFFSYRRTTHRRQDDYGRQISAIMITEN
ncbi:YfiH family protein [Rhizobium sp. SG_E_25_P2]|jgi:polyphenol oxidase|uniref:peptidoglycan editing factor PgeF n=1 Tax=Rhizobium sp. SG_E_25_P2 TaxID=2879942 RepID=UPI0024744ED7|nr:peptidoglycan editing factor PgeF [Rhizobium sp. SG_E_25_P2]MDH6266965.1 YfiH family protein [Rhizobium sp. SG_E_25_P2]